MFLWIAPGVVMKQLIKSHTQESDSLSKIGVAHTSSDTGADFAGEFVSIRDRHKSV